MDGLEGNLWEWNLNRVVVVDVTDDYRYMLTPMPGEFYPVVTELWLPRHRIARSVQMELVEGYLYDWHQVPSEDRGDWYVGVVSAELAFGANRVAQVAPAS